MKVRACWSALENKAERKIALLRDETTRAQALRQSLLSSQAKLEEMYKEYHEKNAALSDTKGREVLVPASKISYVEVGESSDRRVGFANQ